jgi:hypothetical protein
MRPLTSTASPRRMEHVCIGWQRLHVILLASAAVALAMAGGGRAIAQVTPETMNGVPLLPIPTYEETGLPAFTMPTGATALGSDMPAGGDGSTPGTGTGDGSAGATPGTGNGDAIGSAASSWNQYAGQAVGSGQCVALVQAADASVGLTRTWAQGAQVQGNTELRPGTAIATFDSTGRYANATNGSSHAAIYLGQNAQGIQVMDQWSDHAASYRTISWNNPGATAANTGSAFYVVSRAS